VPSKKSYVVILSADPYSLKNHGTDHLVEEMFNMAKETMDFPMAEKMKFEQGDDGRSFG